MKVGGVVVAAGSGSRFGSRKQFLELRSRRVVDWALDAARSVCDVVVVVVPSDALSLSFSADVVVAGGASRAGSVRAGLDALPSHVDVVVVHDGARPLASARLFRSVVDAVVAGADGAVPGLPVVDTVKRVDAGVVVETVDRAALVAVQTPQAFLADVLRRAHGGGAEGTDDAALVEAVGGRVVVVEGESGNLKITTPEDLAVAHALLG